MVNKIWGIFIIIGSIFCLFSGKTELLSSEILNSAKSSFELMLKIFPMMALWMGISNIALKSGLLNRISKLVSPILGRLFPEIPKDHESIGFISSNLIVNMFGLGSAATPLGLRAMKSLQELNKKKDTASKSMITFLVLNTSGMTIIPTTVIALRMTYGSVSPTSIVVPCLIATCLSTIAGLIMNSILAKRLKNDSKSI